MRAAVHHRYMRGDEPSLLVRREYEAPIHHREPFGCVPSFNRMRFGLHQVIDERGGVGGRREDIHIGIPVPRSSPLPFTPTMQPHQIEHHVGPLILEGFERR